MADHLFVTYDGRAKLLGTDEAQVLCTAGSLAEAQKDSSMFGECDIYSYDITIDGELINEQYVETRNG